MAGNLSPHNTLDEPGLRLLRFLVGYLPKVKPNDQRTYVGYKEIHDALKLAQEGPTFGESLKHQGLTSLANWTLQTGKPAITGLIIDRNTLMPGDGYFDLFGRTAPDFEWWRTEIEKSIAFDWGQYLSSNDEASGDVGGESWTNEELAASVQAYVEMQQLDRDHKPYTKRKYYDDLAERFGRSAKAFEYRMQNISYVLSVMGRDWLTGLKPAKNVGARVAAQIEELIAELEGQAITPVAAFEISVRDNISKNDLPEPAGNQTPKTSTTSVTQYERDARVKAWILKKAEGICECCNQQAPFNGPDGRPYLEVHHVRKLAEKGADSTENAVAVCPNCHRELHYGQNSKNLVEKLYEKIRRLKRQ